MITKSVHRGRADRAFVLEVAEPLIPDAIQCEAPAARRPLGGRSPGGPFQHQPSPPKAQRPQSLTPRHMQDKGTEK